jgi:four helix bundle protein
VHTEVLRVQEEKLSYQPSAFSYQLSAISSLDSLGDMKDYKQLIVWQKGMRFVSTAYALSRQLPKSDQYGLTSQLTRSAVSIVSNIAEGSSRKSQRDYYRFLEIAYGSCIEAESLLLVIAQEYAHLSSGAEDAVSAVVEIKKMLYALQQRLLTES